MEFVKGLLLLFIKFTPELASLGHSISVRDTFISLKLWDSSIREVDVGRDRSSRLEYIFFLLLLLYHLLATLSSLLATLAYRFDE